MKKNTLIWLVLLMLFVATKPASAEPKWVTLQQVQAAIGNSLTPINAALTSLSARLTGVENGLVSIPGQVSSLQNQLSQAKYDNATQSAKIVELEQRVAALEASSTPEPSYIVSDASWKFSTTQVAGWQDASFDDSDWINAQAPSGGQCSPAAIGLLINAHGAQPMSVSSPNWATGTGYFRKAFQLAGQPSAASVRVVLDDDGDLYLNGHQVLTDHDNAIAGVQEVAVPTSYFASGTNVLALIVQDSLGGCQHAQLEVEIQN